MSGIYRGKPIQEAGSVSLRVVESASVDYNTLNAEKTGYVTTTVRWLSPDDFQISSSFETIKATGDEYTKESFLVPPLYFTGSFFGEFKGTNAAFSGSITASGASIFYGPVSITGTTTHTGSVFISGAIRLDPTDDPGNTYPSSSFLFQSASNNNLGTDLYIRQDGQFVKFNWLADQLFSGLLYGGVVTYAGNTVYISSGSGIIVDYNANSVNEAVPTITYVTWPDTSFVPTYLAVRQVTYISMDSSGAVVQSYTPFTRDDYYERIVLGAVGHFDLTNVTAFQGAAQTLYGQPMQTNTFIDAFGPLKLSGYELTAQSSSFKLSVASGTSFVHGGFYDYDPTRPSTITTSTQATASLAYVYRNGSGGVYFDTNGGAFYTNVTSSKYDDGSGTPASVSNNNWTIQRVMSDPRTGKLYIYYGRTIYATKADALAGLSTDTFSEGDTVDFTTFLGYLVLKSNTTNLANTTDNSVLAAGLFRGISAGGGSSGGGTTSPGGSNTQIQYNNASSFGGVPVLIYDGTTLRGTGSFSGSFTGALVGTSSWASNATTASYVLNAISSSFATSASRAAQAGNTSTIDVNVFGSPVDSYLLMSNVAGTTGVAIGGDADLRYNSSTNVLTVGNVSATNLTGSHLGNTVGTASWASNATTASYVLSAVSSSFATTASYVLNAISSSFTTTASLAISAQTALTASVVVITPTGSSDVFYPATVLYPGPNKLSQILYVSNSFYYNAGKQQFTAPSFVQTATGVGFIGSASFATSASWAPTGSTFPYIGVARITGSLIVSGTYGGINTFINKPALYDSNNVARVLWAGGALVDASNATSIDWQTRYLQDSVETTRVDWQNGTLNDSAGSPSIDWESRTFAESTGTWIPFQFDNDIHTTSQLYHRSNIAPQVQRSLSDTPTYAGQVIQATVDVGVSNYQLVFLDTDGTWKGVKNTVANGATKMLGVAVDAAGGYVLIEGDTGVSDDNSQGGYVIGADHGLPIYISATTGVMTTTAPSGTGEVVRIVGHIYYQSTTDANWWTMKLRPSNDWYEI